jgi:hypothetical protein
MATFLFYEHFVWTPRGCELPVRTNIVVGKGLKAKPFSYHMRGGASYAIHVFENS